MDSRRRDYFLVILSSVFWGTSFPGSKLAVGTVDPLFLTMARLGIGALLGVAVLLALRRFDVRVFRDPFVWALGTMNAFAFDLQNVGISITTASKTALLVNVNIVIIAILMVSFYRERITVHKIAGIVIGLFGVVVLATHLDVSFLQGGEYVGDVLVFLSGLIWAFYIVGTKARVDRGGDFIAWTTGVLAVTSLVAAVPVLLLRTPIPSDTLGWTGIVYLGLVPTFTPLLLFTYSMRTISPTISSLLILLEVVVAAILSFAFLADPIDAFTLIGGALILFGAYVVSRGEREIPEPGAGGLAPVPADTAMPAESGVIRR